MYRTAHVHAYDVLDTIFVSCQLTQWDGDPAEVEKKQLLISAECKSFGDDDPTIWLWRALQAMQEELDSTDGLDRS